MKHFRPRQIELKDAGDDPNDLVQKALGDLTKNVGDRLKALEEKGLDPKLIERLDRIEAKANRPGDKAEDEQAAGERKAFHAYMQSGKNAPAEELKTLTVSSDPQGGYLAPAEMSTEFIRELVEFSPIRALASVRNTSSPSVQYPRRTGITNSKWKGETQDREGSEPAFGQVDVPVREVNTYVDLSNQLLQDAPAAEAEVRLALAEDFGQKEGLAFVKGSLPIEPEGIMTNPDVAFHPSGDASDLGDEVGDLLILFMYTLPTVYRGRGTWLMNSTTLGVLRTVKFASADQYLWQPNYQVGQPELLLGRPVLEVPDMDDIGAGKEPIAFGDIETAYRILDRSALSILVDPYTRATNGITRIHATRRVGGAVVQPNAIKKIRCVSAG